jgi:hypothetical protein
VELVQVESSDSIPMGQETPLSTFEVDSITMFNLSLSKQMGKSWLEEVFLHTVEQALPE